MGLSDNNIIYVPGKPGICFHYYCAVYDECKLSDTFWLADRTRLFVQYTISLSSWCKLIWRHWTYKMPVRYILSSVWVRLSIFSLLSIIQYVGLYVFRLPISLVMIEIIYILCLIIIIKSEVWTIYYPLFRVRSLSNGVRSMSFYILITCYDQYVCLFFTLYCFFFLATIWFASSGAKCMMHDIINTSWIYSFGHQSDHCSFSVHSYFNQL